MDRTEASLHKVSNFEIEFVSPDRARSRCALHTWKHFRDKPGDLRRYVHYVEEWARTAGGWRQSHLEYRVLGETGATNSRGREHLGENHAA